MCDVLFNSKDKRDYLTAEYAEESKNRVKPQYVSSMVEYYITVEVAEYTKKTFLEFKTTQLSSSLCAKIALSLKPIFRFFLCDPGVLSE